MDNFRGRDGQGWGDQGRQELGNFSVGLLSVAGLNRFMVIQDRAEVMSSSMSSIEGRQGLLQR